MAKGHANSGFIDLFFGLMLISGIVTLLGSRINGILVDEEGGVPFQ